jgi:hypothetical protein
MGDSNVNPQASHEIRNAVCNGTIHDIAAEWTPADSPIQNTFSKTGIHANMDGNGITRIDALLGNTPAAHVVYNFEYVWEDAIGFDHLPFRLTTSHKSFTQCMTTLRKPTAINVAMIVDFKFTSETKQQIFDDTCLIYKNVFNTCIHNEDVDGAHKSWCHAAEHFCHRLEQLCSDLRSTQTSKPSRDKLLKFETKKLTVEWNSTRSTIDDIEAKTIVDIIAGCREVLAIMKRRWKQCHTLAHGNDLECKIDTFLEDNHANSSTAMYLWANTGEHAVERNRRKRIILHAESTHITFESSPTPYSVKTHHDNLLKIHASNSNILRSNAARDHRDNMAKGGKDFYKFIKRDYRGN